MGKSGKKKPDYMKKGNHQGKACRRGVPIDGEEVKIKLNLTLQPFSIEKLGRLASKANLSRSKLIEKWILEAEE